MQKFLKNQHVEAMSATPSFEFWGICLIDEKSTEREW